MTKINYQMYQMIRGPIAEARCATGKGVLYCECGCQEPRPGDPEINLDGVTVVRKSPEGYANYILARNGVRCGRLNTQYNCLFIDGHEFLGVDREPLRALEEAAWALPEEDDKVGPGDTLEETAARVATEERISLAEQDALYSKHPGYCRKCHSFCYGDCEAD